MKHFPVFRAQRLAKLGFQKLKIWVKNKHENIFLENDKKISTGQQADVPRPCHSLVIERRLICLQSLVQEVGKDLRKISLRVQDAKVIKCIL